MDCKRDLGSVSKSFSSGAGSVEVGWAPWTGCSATTCSMARSWRRRRREIEFKAFQSISRRSQDLEWWYHQQSGVPSVPS